MQYKNSGSPLCTDSCRANDVRSLIVICTNAMFRHEAIVNVDSQSDAAFVPALGRLMRCQKCGQRGADVRPYWKERNARGPDHAVRRINRLLIIGTISPLKYLRGSTGIRGAVRFYGTARRAEQGKSWFHEGHGYHWRVVGSGSVAG